MLFGLAQLGARVCIIEKNGMGGTCTQRGCIPTKYLHSLGDIVRRTAACQKVWNKRKNPIRLQSHKVKDGVHNIETWLWNRDAPKK